MDNKQIAHDIALALLKDIADKTLKEENAKGAELEFYVVTYFRLYDGVLTLLNKRRSSYESLLEE